jgi:hypothetical protein
MRATEKAPDVRGRPERVIAANDRARAVERAARAALREGNISRHTPRGEVTIVAVDLITTAEVEFIEVRAAPSTESGETHFRIVNPPIGVRRPDGSVEEDPLGALAEVLAQFGGALRAKRRRAR